jgi:hypothetical protein
VKNENSKEPIAGLTTTACVATTDRETRCGNC